MPFRTDEDTKFWKKALQNATEQYQACKTRLDALDVERTEIQEEMQRLEKLIAHVEPFTTEYGFDVMERFVMEYEPPPESTLSDAIRIVLYQAQRYMTPIEIRDVLEASKYDLTRHPNPLASIHGILKRWDESGDVAMVQSGNKTAYRLHPHDRGVTGSVRVRKTANWYKTLTEAQDGVAGGLRYKIGPRLEDTETQPVKDPNRRYQVRPREVPKKD